MPRGEHGNDTVAHARSYCVVVQVDNFCEVLPHFSGHLQPACNVWFSAAQTGSRAMDTLHGIQMCDFMTVTRYDTALGRSKHSLCYMHGCHLCAWQPAGWAQWAHHVGCRRWSHGYPVRYNGSYDNDNGNSRSFIVIVPLDQPARGAGGPGSQPANSTCGQSHER